MNYHSLPLRLGLAFGCLLATAHLTQAADIEPWAGIPGVSASTNWSDTANWAGTAHNPNDNQVFFGNATAVALGVINSVVDTSTNCYSLNFTNTVAYNNLLIQPGQTLKIDGTTTLVGGIGGAAAALYAVPAGQFITTNTISGQYGTILITGSSAGGVIVCSTNSAASNIGPMLDMSGLGTFIISNTGAYCSLWVGNGANRSDGVLFLAMTNYLALTTNGTGNAAALVVGDNTSNNGSSPGGTLNLGQTNTILADNISVGMSKQNSATVRFNPAFVAANPSVFIRGFSGAAVKKWSIGDGLSQSGTSAAGSGICNFNGGTVNATVTVMVLGRPSSTSVTTPNSSGTLSFSAGTISATILTNAAMTTVAGNGATPTNQVATGAVNVTGTATFNANSVVMAILLGTGGSSTGSFNVTNGTLAVSTISVGTGNSTININGGTLVVTNTVGTTAAPLTALNLSSANVQLNVSGAANVTNIVATTVGTSGTTTITINSVASVTGTTTIPLMGYTGADPFASLTLAPLPTGYTGTLVDNSSNNRIDLQVSPPSAGASLVWVGATNAVLIGDWDTVTTNWLDAATMSVPSAYADLDSVVFNDSASNNVVTLTTNVAPFSILITNNALNYTLTGTGKISGATSLIKDGPGSLTLSESGGDSFNGGIIVSNGTLVLDNAGSGISGGLNIVSGAVQVGDNDANGNLPSGALTDNGSLDFNRTDSFTVSSAITGTGSVTKNNNNVLSLSGNNAYAGGLVVNSGTVRLGATNAAGTGAITVNPGGMAVLTVANITNNVTLAGGTLAAAATQNPMHLELTAAAGTTSTLLLGDPANLGATDPFEVAFTNAGTWHGSGTVIVVTVTNDPSPDAGNGFRLRGLAASDFSGTLVLSNGLKGELQTTVAGPFSPVGAGKIVVCAGVLTNNTVNGTFAELNLRNIGSSSTTFGNDVEIYGSGLAVIDPLGTAPVGSSVTMGNLKIGDGQEVGVDVNGTGPDHTVIFPTVTLNGGICTFSPKTPNWNTTPQIGSDLSLGNISELSPSSLVMNGLRTLFLTGNSTYSGSTTVSNGVLEVDGSIQGAGNVSVETGAVLTGTGLILGPVAIAAGGTLSPGNAATGTASLSISNSLTLAGTNVMDVNKSGSTFLNDVITNLTTVTYGGTLQLNLTGTALAAGDAFTLYSCSSATGAFATISPTAPGTGLLWNTNTLAVGVLSVVAAVNPNPTNITATVSSGILTLSWPADHTGWVLQVQTNTLADGLNNTWTDVAGSAATNLVNVPLDSANGSVFYRMIYNP